MLTISNTYPEKLFNKEKAIALAEEMNANEDDDWEYRPVHCPKGTGFSFIEIYDKDGEFVGKL